MTEMREQIVELILEMRSLPACIEHAYRRPLMREYTTVSEIFVVVSYSFGTLRDEINNFCSNNAVDPYDVSIENVTVPDRYEDFDDDAIRVFYTRLETDEEYLARLKNVYMCWLINAQSPIPDKDWLSIVSAINERLYVARNITADESIVKECLDALGSIYHARTYDCNGQATVADRNRRQLAVYAKLAAIYC